MVSKTAKWILGGAAALGAYFLFFRRKKEEQTFTDKVQDAVSDTFDKVKDAASKAFTGFTGQTPSEAFGTGRTEPVDIRRTPSRTVLAISEPPKGSGILASIENKLRSISNVEGAAPKASTVQPTGALTTVTGQPVLVTPSGQIVGSAALPEPSSPRRTGLKADSGRTLADVTPRAEAQLREELSSKNPAARANAAALLKKAGLK